MIARNNRGFTLIEVLVVLIIMVVISAIASMSFGHFGRGRREKMIVQQFVRTIPVAQQQALLTPCILGLGITNTGYHFYQYEQVIGSEKGKWSPLHDDQLSNRAAFKNIFQVMVKSVGKNTFAKPGAAQNTSQSANEPSILFLSSGSVTPFQLELTTDQHVWLITVASNGAVTSHMRTGKK